MAEVRRGRAKHAAIFAHVVGAVDDAVVSGDKMTGRFRGLAVEILLSEGAVNEYASMVVVLKGCAGRVDWCIQYGRLGQRRRRRGWRVSSPDPAVVERLTTLGAPALVRPRYAGASAPWEAELQPPSVCYCARRSELSYAVAVGGVTMETLKPEHLSALLDLLWTLSVLNDFVPQHDTNKE